MKCSTKAGLNKLAASVGVAKTVRSTVVVVTEIYSPELTEWRKIINQNVKNELSKKAKSDSWVANG